MAISMARLRASLLPMMPKRSFTFCISDFIPKFLVSFQSGKSTKSAADSKSFSKKNEEMEDNMFLIP
jgi:hypothetical protein